MAVPGADLSKLQTIMGHASPETTAQYVHHAAAVIAAEHRRIERHTTDPLHRHQRRRGRGDAP